MLFVPLCELMGQLPEQTLCIKFIGRAQTVCVCSRSGSRAVPLFLRVCTSERDREPSVHAMSTSSACALPVQHCTPKLFCMTARANTTDERAGQSVLMWLRLEAVMRSFGLLRLERHNNQMLILPC